MGGIRKGGWGLWKPFPPALGSEDWSPRQTPMERYQDMHLNDKRSLFSLPGIEREICGHACQAAHANSHSPTQGLI